ncbi:MFS transporter [Microlunatus elymi]|uniref:MFS transporter n=1 Tax=Microlunatus elymi TaxID=2596828 RepID=A0A516PZQ5_9ACTN|nr:MFS transporter [Microlunatus elymi]QDP96627.1 MFS transporter [Microlunatus elymi]
MTSESAENTNQRWTSAQRSTLFAGVASWTLDAFDYFILVFVLTSVATAFHTTVVTASLAITLTLALRPVGALIFGAIAERIGRKPVLMANIVIFAVIELLTALAPNLTTFITLRVIYGVAMGGIWGVASALTMETIPQHSRGRVSGLFQAGYPLGYLIASIIYGLLFVHIGWRGMFAIGVVPILLAVFIGFRVKESPVWLAARGGKDQPKQAMFWPAVRKHWPTMIYAIILMAAFNYFSHGTQDMYPTFLKEQHGFTPGTVSIIAICYNIAAIIGGIVAGTLSQRYGRKKIIMIFALLALPCIPLWAFATGVWALGVGAFLIQFMVQGAWGVIPAYLNELMPEGTRAILPGFVYQVGNVIASPNATLQASIAQATGGNYGLAMAIVAGTVAIVIAIMIFFGKETRDTHFLASADATARGTA